jgi:nucleotide-binding universal stress UspA family protein
MKILCGTDLGPRAHVTTEVAALLARWTGGSLELVHVVAPDVRSLAVAADAPPGVTVVDGTPHRALLDRAREVGADLLVIGAHGRPALERLLLGSVAERTVRAADRPVLVVPPGLESWPKAAELRVVAGLDGRRASEGVVELVRRLRAHIPCQVTFLRLYWAPEEYERLGLTGARSLEGSDPEVVADLDKRLRRQIGVLPGKGEVTVVVEATWGDPSWRLLEAARDRHADLVVVGAESRHGWARLAHPPIAERMARHAREVPVLFVPAAAQAPGTRALETEVPRIRTVLAPTDLSAAGNRAVRFAYSLVGEHGGVVELCHVHERPLPTPSFAYDPPAGRLEPQRRAEIEQALWTLVPPEAERLGITSHVTVVDGGAAGEAIVQAAERLDVDAIALGSHGRGAAARTLMGSVADVVVRRAGRPVLVVKGASP